MKPLYALAFSAAVLMSWSAVAETTVPTTSRNCRTSAYGPETCTTTTTTWNGRPAIPETDEYRGRAAVPGSEGSAHPQVGRVLQADRFFDDMGITRLRYAHAGCDLGRSGDGGSVAQMQ